MAVTDRARRQGISAFVVEGEHTGPAGRQKEDKLGMRASETCEVILQNCRVPGAQLIGEAGRGFIQTLQVLDAAASASPRWRWAWRRAPTRPREPTAADRRQFGRSIDGFQSIRWKLVDTRASRRRGCSLSRGVDEGSGPAVTLESSMAKLYSSGLRSGLPRTRPRSSAGTASSRSTRRRSSSATSSSRPSARAPAKCSAW